MFIKKKKIPPKKTRKRTWSVRKADELGLEHS